MDSVRLSGMTPGTPNLLLIKNADKILNVISLSFMSHLDKREGKESD